MLPFIMSVFMGTLNLAIPLTRPPTAIDHRSVSFHNVGQVAVPSAINRIFRGAGKARVKRGRIN